MKPLLSRLATWSDSRLSYRHRTTVYILAANPSETTGWSMAQVESTPSEFAWLRRNSRDCALHRARISPHALCRSCSCYAARSKDAWPCGAAMSDH